MELWVGAINLGFLYAFMAMGVFITFRIHDFPDITVDGSFVTGAAVTAVLTVAGVNPFIALLLSFLAAALAGAFTAFIHTRFNINGLLAGILVMTGLYSVNLHIMGRSNIPLLNQPGIINYLKTINPGLAYEGWLCIVFCAVIFVFWALTSIFFKTDFGITMRATGNNPAMAAASGVNVNIVKTIGIALANGLVGISGSLVAQYQGFADIGMGIGSIVFGLAAVIIGESVIKIRSVYGKALSVIIGSIVFRFMVALALYAGLNPIDLKLTTALFVLAILIAPKMLAGRGSKIVDSTETIARKINVKKLAAGIIAVVLITAAGILGYKLFSTNVYTPSKKVRIGVVQLTDHALLNITRDSFIEEMKKLGYEDRKNVSYYIENANGDMTTVNSIIDKFLYEKVNIVVPISTGCTQAAINKIKDRPIVFATVANPFILGAGKSETDHLPNVTGTYGAAPSDKLMEMVAEILPKKIKVGCIWDPSQENAVYNVKKLKETIAQYKNVTFIGATVAGSSEVYQAATSLVTKGIDAFVLTSDNIVFSAFESIVKASETKKIPIFISDVERLKDGALGACGYDYSLSGIQAARIADRIIKGEKPVDIPFEKYSKITKGINLDISKKLGITIPQKILSEATMVGDKIKNDIRPKRLALFVFSDSYVLKISIDGIMDEFKKSGILKEYNLTVDLKNAQNDYATAQAIVQDIVRQNYDYILTVSSLALQVAANGNSKIPHIFGTVTDPYRMGIAKNQKEHLPNITGIATFQPVESTFKAIKAILPRARRIGIIWNPAEANSEACTLKAREAAKKYGYELIERTISTTDEVKDALSALINKDIDIFFTSGDNTVILALATMATILSEHKIPYFTNDPTDIERGTFFSIGADYFEVGVETAKIAERVIKGEDTKNIPIRDFVPEKIGINAGLAKLYGVTVPDAFLKKAAIIKR
ncbi:MAG: substrate-binding domain-containing protein [Proteobacteria bacterium]|nr:substrate-binding domain-containing protein [Pseudomonadota bacterium]